MDRPLIRRTTLRQRLREQVESAYPDKLTSSGEVNLTRQRLLDAVLSIPASGIAKVRDVRAFLRAAERARELTHSGQVSLASLLREWPMTLPDDTLIKRIPEMEPPEPEGRPNWNIYIFIQVTRYDNWTGTVTRSIALAARRMASTGLFFTTSEWEWTQMYDWPDAEPPRTRTLDITYWVRERDPAAGNTDPTWTDPGLVYNGPVSLNVSAWDRDTSLVYDTFSVLIDDIDGVTRSHSTTAAHPIAELIATSVAPA